MSSTDRPILFAYDGSPNADRAIDVAAELLGGGRAELVHAWEPAYSAAARSAVYLYGAIETEAAFDEEQNRARLVAERGAERARAAGFDVHATAVSGNAPVWHTLDQQIAAIDPRLVVMGSRGLTGVRAAMGSVSHHVASHAAVPVLTVPPAADQD
jgi:nucleotide-binding universal stress UspA family protein